MTWPVWPNGQGASPPKEEITGSSPVMGIAAEIQEQLSVNEELLHMPYRERAHTGRT